MNKRTLSSDENDNDKNKAGVKRYLMSNDDHFENQKLYQEKNGNSKLNTNPLIEIKEDDEYVNNINTNINGNSTSDDLNCDNSNVRSCINGNDREENKYGSVNNISEYTYSNGNNGGGFISSAGGFNGDIGNMGSNSHSGNGSDCGDGGNACVGGSNPNSNVYYANDSKKRKGSRYLMPFLKKEKNSVSTSLLLNNVPADADEEDVKSFMRPFLKNKIPEIIYEEEGIVVKLYDDELNETIFNYFNEHPTQIKGSFINVKLSKVNEDGINREDLKEPESGANNGGNGGGVDTIDGGESGSRNANSGVGDGSGIEGDAMMTQDKKNGKHNKNECSKVILVSVVNLQYPVDIELIYYLFSKCGVVEKIITFSRTPIVYQALVQFKNVEAAKEAIRALNNRNIYDGCNTIQIQFSFLKELVVKANNSSSWDYTTSSMQRNRVFPNFQNSHGVLPTPTSKKGKGNNPPESTKERKNKDSELYQMIERKFKLVDFETKNSSKTPVLICYNIPKDYTDVNKYSNYLFSSLAQECLQHARIGEQILELHFSKIHDIRISAMQKKGDSYKAKSFTNYDQRYLVRPKDYDHGTVYTCRVHAYNMHCDEVNSRETLSLCYMRIRIYVEACLYTFLADQAKYIKGACKPTKTLFISNVSEEVNEHCIMTLFSKYDEIKKWKFQPVKEGKKHLTITVELNSEDIVIKKKKKNN
ncbi:polypyrimidine tract binding protein [Plasmodium ovale wallikeri]|uniref:Polypyrimidine tract binding protein n=1 Tax=Plasmodium ovale wallikeri TaxID=864142 RepID=A0A1A8Z5F3_PLAOA|nr:polypyrimidine tract binding protein [Plasmodium ovale wallikeri]